MSFINKIQAAGIVGAGGAGFPTHVKMNAKVDTVIANGAECEPLLRVDQQIMAVYAAEIVNAIDLVVKHTGAQRGFIALKKKHHAAIDALTQALAAHGNSALELRLLNNYYPAGDEQVLVYDLTGRVVPEGGIPLNVQTLVTNVHTLLQIHYAQQDQPVTWRFITVTGAVKKPGTFKVAIGTSFAELLKRAGGVTIPAYRCVVGGPMMGSISASDQEVVTKTTSGLIVLPADHYVITSKTSSLDRSIILARSACCQCTYCTQACPRNLLGHSIEPHKVMRAVAFGIGDSALVEHALYCVSCGVCTYYACPMGIDPFRLCTAMKQELLKQGMKPKAKKESYQAREYAADRKVPVPQLIAKLDLDRYDIDAPLTTDLFAPASVRIKLKQQVGAPSKPVVNVGDRVTSGQLVAEAGGPVSACQHASIGGTVAVVDNDGIVIKQ